MERCKTCRHWRKPEDYQEEAITQPIDQDTYKPMQRGFESRICKHPTQAHFEAPVSADAFALTDASNYFVSFATGENFGCVLHES